VDVELRQSRADVRNSSGRGEIVVGDVQVDWGSSKDGKRAAVRAQKCHIGRASGSAWKAKKKTPKRHAGEQSVCKYLNQGW
jgi:hypothetical protein